MQEVMEKAKPKRAGAAWQTRQYIAWMLSQGKEPALIRCAVEMAPCEEREKQRILQELHMEGMA